MSRECIDVFLNKGKWKNQSIKSISINCYIFIILIFKGVCEKEEMKIFCDFISLNTSVKTLYFGYSEFQFSDLILNELKLNTNLTEIKNIHSNLCEIYLQRNRDIAEILEHFLIPISQVKLNDVGFHYR
jgi:hypothetical protein